MKLLPLLMLFSATANAADYTACTGLLEGKDSVTIQIPQVDVYQPKLIITQILSRSCRGYSKIYNFSCKRFRANDPATEVCYAETNAGYFFITRDYMENVNIIVSRWD